MNRVGNGVGNGVGARVRRIGIAGACSIIGCDERILFSDELSHASSQVGVGFLDFYFEFVEHLGEGWVGVCDQVCHCGWLSLFLMLGVCLNFELNAGCAVVAIWKLSCHLSGRLEFRKERALYAAAVYCA